MTVSFHHSYFVCPNGGCCNCTHVIFTEEVTLEELKERYGEFMAIEDAYGNPKVSTSNDVAFEKGERHGAKQGVLRTQAEVGGQSYPGRPVPKAEAVKTAEVEKGKAVECAKKQTGMNRFPINKHEADHKTHGPNN